MLSTTKRLFYISECSLLIHNGGSKGILQLVTMVVISVNLTRSRPLWEESLSKVLSSCLDQVGLRTCLWGIVWIVLFDEKRSILLGVWLQNCGLVSRHRKHPSILSVVDHGVI